MTDFHKQVMNRLTRFIAENREAIEEWCEDNHTEYTPEAHFSDLQKQVENLRQRGFSVFEAYLTLTNTEEIDPRIPESRALWKMTQISNQVKERNKQ